MPGSVRVVVDEEAQGRHDLAGAAFPVEVERAGAVVEEQRGIARPSAFAPLDVRARRDEFRDGNEILAISKRVVVR
jgi:hypothetical protein